MKQKKLIEEYQTQYDRAHPGCKHPGGYFEAGVFHLGGKSSRVGVFEAEIVLQKEIGDNIEKEPKYIVMSWVSKRIATALAQQIAHNLSLSFAVQVDFDELASLSRIVHDFLMITKYLRDDEVGKAAFIFGFVMAVLPKSRSLDDQKPAFDYLMERLKDVAVVRP